MPIVSKYASNWSFNCRYSWLQSLKRCVRAFTIGSTEFFSYQTVKLSLGGTLWIKNSLIRWRCPIFSLFSWVYWRMRAMDWIITAVARITWSIFSNISLSAIVSAVDLTFRLHISYVPHVNYRHYGFKKKCILRDSAVRNFASVGNHY